MRLVSRQSQISRVAPSLDANIALPPFASDDSRDSSQTSFLNQTAEEGYTNLKVFALTMAKKINFDPNKKATGVVVESNLLS